SRRDEGRQPPLRRRLYGKLHQDRVGRMILVLYFGLGEGSLAIGAPVNGLQSLVKVAPGGHLPEHANLRGFEALIQGNVRVIPVAPYSQPLKVSLLPLQVRQRELPALAA